MTTTETPTPTPQTDWGTSLAYIILGAFLQALGYSVFIAPAEIVPGGVYGIAIVINYLTHGLFAFTPHGLPIGAIALCFNFPLLFLAIRKIGLSSGPKTVLTFILISLFTDLIGYLNHGASLVPGDKFLAAFYGGSILGLGVALIFRAGSTSAGTDVLARVLSKGTNTKVSTLIMVVDSCVILLGLVCFRDWSVPLYSGVTLFVYSKVVDMLQPENPMKAVFIVTSCTQEVRDYMIHELRLRGTFIHGRGMYRGAESDIIFTIIERKMINRLKREVKRIDPNAFLSAMDASHDAPYIEATRKKYKLPRNFGFLSKSSERSSTTSTP